MSATSRGHRNLVIVRAGDHSLHRQWVDGPQRNFDLFVSYFGNDAAHDAGDVEYFEVRKGLKWPAISDLLQAHPELVQRYDVFWFPDDDLLAGADTISRMFDLFRAFGLALAQPALTRDSYYSWPLVLQDHRYYLRFIQFVEVMAPIFDLAALETCRPTFNESSSGWGLDFIWPQLCADRGSCSVAIIDATPVRHTRPVGGGELYRNHQQLAPKQDRLQVMARYGIDHRVHARAKYLLGGVRRVRLPWWQRLFDVLTRKPREWNYLRKQQRAISRAGN